MKSKRRRRSRLRGRRTCGGGSRKKRRGKGSRGGHGMAGTGKKSGTLKLWVSKYAPDWLGGKVGFVSRRKDAFKTINLDFIEKNIDNFIKSGEAKKFPDRIEIELKDYKILGAGNIKTKFIMKAFSASKQAVKKVEQAGGKLEVQKKEIKVSAPAKPAIKSASPSANPAKPAAENAAKK